MKSSASKGVGTKSSTFNGDVKMTKLTDYIDSGRRLYIVPGGELRKSKTHIGYFKDFYLSNPNEFVMACCPSFLYEICVGSPCDCSDGFSPSPTDVEWFDDRLNEVTCPTCLKRIQGKQNPEPLSLEM